MPVFWLKFLLVEFFASILVPGFIHIKNIFHSLPSKPSHTHTHTHTHTHSFVFCYILLFRLVANSDLVVNKPALEIYIWR